MVRKKTVVHSKASDGDDQFSRNPQVVEPWALRDHAS
jgi:hypothetical protein